MDCFPSGDADTDLELGTGEGLEDYMNDEADRELAVFTEAVKVPVHDRAACLDHACGGNQDLRRQVEALLRAHDRIGDFLEEPPTGESSE
jgi:hypothetical protein